MAGSGSCTTQQAKADSIVHMAAILNTVGAKIYIFLFATQLSTQLRYTDKQNSY